MSLEGFDESLSTIFVSYSWGHRPEDVRAVADALKKTGLFNVWIDTQQMSGSTIEKMAEGIDNADLFLMCFSRPYKDSENCKKEAEYATQQKTPILPLRMQSDEDDDPDAEDDMVSGWLGFVMGSKLWVDFKKGQDVKQVAEQIKTQAQKLIADAEASYE